MKVGSLFSGGGLGDFGFMAAGMKITWQCEIDEYCQKILALRYPDSKKYWDIKTLKGSDLESVEIITGGFPCQPFSVAGKRKGQDDNRYLWPEMLRIIKECRPRWVVGENVPGIVNMALDDVCSDLENEGYEVRPIIFPAHAIGAQHKRDRLWIVGYARLFGSSLNEKQTAGIEQSSKIMADTTSGSRQSKSPQCDERRLQEKLLSNGWYSDYWEIEPAIRRVVDVCPNRIHRLRMLGNGQVPACTYVIGKMIMDVENIFNPS